MLDNNLFWIIIIMFSSMVQWNILNISLNEIYTFKGDKLISNIHLLVSTIIVAIIILNKFNIILSLFIYVILIYIYCRYQYDMDNLKSIVISFIYLIIIIAVYSLVYKMIFTISTTVVETLYCDYYDLLNNKIIKLELIITANVLLLFLIPITKSIKLKSEIRERHYLYILFSIIGNIICVLVVFGLVYRYTLGFTTIYIDIIIIAISSIALLSSIFSVSLINRIIEDNRLRLENKVIKENIDIQYKYYLNLQEAQSKVKKLYHDMKNHMICIEDIYGSNDYIKSINDQLDNCNSTFNTGNMVLDVILKDKNSICNKNNINLFVDVIFNECDFIKVPDICSIFSNMLDNSIDACMKIDDTSIKRNIKLRGTIVNRFFVIKCENTKINNINFNGNKILTDKKDSFLHGIGINSIKSSVERYNGNVEIDISDNKFIMTIYIPLIREVAQLDT